MNIENLKKLREKKSLTQIQVAKAVGVTATAYRNWEYGANKPSEDHMKKLEDILRGERK